MRCRLDVKLSRRALAIEPSPTLTISAKAAKLRAAGEDVINLAAGEPDFGTPENAVEAAIRAMRDGFTKYTLVGGILSLRAAIARKFKNENDLEYSPDEILVSVGCKHSFYNLTQALLDPGDEVIIPAPYWVSYPDMVKLAGGKPVIIEAGIEEGFKITEQQLQRAIGPKTRMLVLNSPSNPTGAAYSLGELKRLGQILEKHSEILIASDDIYEHILWRDERFSNILNACPNLTQQTVVLNGVSKVYAMTGWRIGYAAGPKHLIRAMKDLQSQTTSNATSIAQVAAQAALEGDQGLVEERCRIFKERHDFVYERLKGLPGTKCRASDGTFYIFPEMNALIDQMDNVENDVELGEFLLGKAKVALVPGSAFGAPGYVRLSFATGMDKLKAAMDRLEQAVNS